MNNQSSCGYDTAIYKYFVILQSVRSGEKICIYLLISLSELFHVLKKKLIKNSDGDFCEVVCMWGVS